MFLSICFYDTKIIDCFTQQSSLELNLLSQYIELHLEKSNNPQCNFPDGVLAVLQFYNKALDISQIFHNFSYKNTQNLIFQCQKCEDYNNITDVSVVIDSIGCQSIFTVGIILDVKHSYKYCVADEIILHIDKQIVKMSTSCLQLETNNVFNSAQLFIFTKDEQILKYADSFLQYFDSQSILQVTFNDYDIYLEVARGPVEIQIRISGTINDVYFIQNISINNYSFANQINIYQSTELYVQKDELKLLTKVDITALDNYIEILTKQQADTFGVFIQFQSPDLDFLEIQKFDEFANYRDFKVISCLSTNDAEQCQQSLSKLFDVNIQNVQSRLLFQFYKSGVLINTARYNFQEISLSYFKEAQIKVRYTFIAVDLMKINQNFWMDKPGPTNFTIYYYNTIQDYLNDQNRLTIIQILISNWSAVTNLSFQLPCNIDTVQISKNYAVQHRMLITRFQKSEDVFISQFQVVQEQFITPGLIFMGSYFLFTVLICTLYQLYDSYVSIIIQEKQKITEQMKQSIIPGDYVEVNQ